MTVPTALTIAGSDPSGGAGIQSDLRTFAHLRVHGMAVITALTAQNTLGVDGVFEVPSEFVASQIATIADDIPIGALKTGMLLNRAVIEAVTEQIQKYQIAKVVVDPVMVSTSGTRLLSKDAIPALRSLFDHATLVTPNADEASIITGKPIRTLADMKSAALEFVNWGNEWGPHAVLIKGGHLGGDVAIDVFFDGKNFELFETPRIAVRPPHGTGCVLSAAITAYLAWGKPVREAIRLAKQVVFSSISNAMQLGRGADACNPLGLTQEEKP